MKIEPGFYRTRNGSRARVLCTDAPGDYPVVGYIENGADEPDTMTWTLGGRVSTQETYTSIDDLIEPWRDESVTEQTVTLSLSKLRELLIQASEDVGDEEPLTKEEADAWLIEEGIIPAPAKQPVRVSGWGVCDDTGDLMSNLFRTELDADNFNERHYNSDCFVVYVTGTEGVGPEGEK